MPILLVLLLLVTALPVSAADPELSFNISEEIVPLQTGSTCQLHYSCNDPNAKEFISWYSVYPEIATVSSDGLVTAHKAGEAMIFAEYNNNIIATDYCILNISSVVEKQWGLIDGFWYLFSGVKKLTGWQYVKNHWYYMANNGVMTTGWQYINNKWYYMDPSGAMTTGWQLIDGYWHFMNDSGDMAYEWLKRGNTWYYLGTGGTMQTGWQKVGGVWYYFASSGAMLTGWQFIDGSWYLLNSSGAMLTGWQKVNGKWYLLDSSGAMLTGWQKVNGTWYYLASSGAMLTGWQLIDGKWYYMDSSGAMLTGWQKINGSWYLLNSSGAMLTGWQQLGSVWYYLQDSGKMATETVTIDGYQQVFHTNGAWINTHAMDTKAAGYSSSTNYLILVSISDHVTKIYKKYGSSWAVEQAYLCTVGDPSKGWDTVTGSFYIGQSSWGNPTWKGYSFEDEDGHTLYYWTRFYNGFLFHSIMYENGSWIETPYSNDLGKSLSHGCVRLRWYNAKWIYDNIPYGTKVVVY